jgi:hypothetical protein
MSKKSKNKTNCIVIDEGYGHTIFKNDNGVCCGMGNWPIRITHVNADNIAVFVFEHAYMNDRGQWVKVDGIRLTPDQAVQVNRMLS